VKAAVVVFPGSNCDLDVVKALRSSLGVVADRLWHQDSHLDTKYDLMVLPGGFSYGDHLRCGAIAAHSKIMASVKHHAARGGYVLGICNGFQILTESGLLPGALGRNTGLKFVCRGVALSISNPNTAFTQATKAQLTLPVAHHDGRYHIDADGLKQLQDNQQIALTYAEPLNGSVADIAGVLSANHRVLGLMPHPERAVEDALGGVDGQGLFLGLQSAIG
jgi:phosphoribosylformylglycinamidine synthase